jgi:hypothetical protein
MNDAKYIGMDVHQATISVAVRDWHGNLVMEAILETKAETILQFIRGLGGRLQLTFEEGTCAGWLHDLLKPLVTRVLVCDPRKNALLKVGNISSIHTSITITYSNSLGSERDAHSSAQCSTAHHLR